MKYPISEIPKIHNGCNSVVLQDCIRNLKIIYVTELPSRDKEDQSKYYLIHSKQPVLDMMWANRDINVEEWANIPKFSALDDLVAPLRLLELFFVTF